MVTISVEVAGTEELLADLERATRDGIDQITERVAETARSSHWYTNRTGDLERSTQSIEAEGSLYDDSLQGSVAATEPYAAYVDARSPILEPAWESEESNAVQLLHDALDAATQ